MQVLIERNLPYVKNLKKSNPGLLWKIENEQKEIIELIDKNYGNSKELNKPLDYHFIFGYYAESKFLFTKNESEEIINVNE